jgi:hypothetical protein
MYLVSSRIARALEDILVFACRRLPGSSRCRRPTPNSFAAARTGYAATRGPAWAVCLPRRESAGRLSESCRGWLPRRMCAPSRLQAGKGSPPQCRGGAARRATRSSSDRRGTKKSAAGGGGGRDASVSRLCRTSRNEARRGRRPLLHAHGVPRLSLAAPRAPLGTSGDSGRTRSKAQPPPCEGLRRGRRGGLARGLAGCGSCTPSHEASFTAEPV